MNQESQIEEYKLIWKDEYLRHICAFANSNGGKLYIGVNDDGSVSGVSNSKELLQVLPNKFRDILGIYTEINLLTENELNYLKIIIGKYEVPISYKGKYFVRVGSTVQELKGSALNDFMLKKMGRSWDSVIVSSSSFKDIDAQTIERFKAMASDRLPSISNEKDHSTILEKLNLSEGGKLKRAAILLFGNNVQREFLQARVKIGFFKGQTDLISTDIVEGNLFQQLEKTLEILRTKYLLSPISYEGVYRREKLEIPFEALREAIINALIHRLYDTTSSIQIRITEQELEIMNECNPSEVIDVQDLKKPHLSKPQNRLLADTFYKAGLIESWGRGTLKIIEDCKVAGLKAPEFVASAPFFTLLFHRSIQNVTENVTGNVTGNVTENRTLRILEMIQQQPDITTSELSKKLNISRMTLHRDLEKLKAGGKIKRMGPAKGGYWEVVNV
jgi:ATP-dependent DNA helicase RecG